MKPRPGQGRLRWPCGLLLAALLIPVAGCRSVGPSTMRRDRLHYSTALADTWREQLLLNVVRTRYGEAPAFLEVSSVVSGYSLETGVSLNGQFSPESLRGDTFAGAGLSGTFTDRPTISYTPMSGEKFARSLMSPVPLDALAFVVQGGVAADFILGLTLQSIEGHQNRGMNLGEFQAADPQFARALRLFRDLQRARAVDFEVLKQGDRSEIWLRFLPPAPADTGTREESAELKALLQVPVEVDRVKVAFGRVSPDADGIGIRTRSLMQILATLGADVQVPAEHLVDGLAFPVGTLPGPGGFTVRSGKDRPEGAFVTVSHGGYWFWIDSRDLPSKTTLAVVTLLFHFLEGGGYKASPVLTIPTN